MWIVQRNFGDEWRSVFAFESQSAAGILAECWHNFGGDKHAGYRVFESDHAPADILLGFKPVIPHAVVRAVIKVALAMCDEMTRDHAEEDPGSAAVVAEMERMWDELSCVIDEHGEIRPLSLP